MIISGSEIQGWIAASSVVFFAGGAYALLRSVRRDVNGVGAKIGQILERHRERANNVNLALMLICKPEEREKVAHFLKDR